MNLDGVFKRIYREWLIAQQVTTVCLFTRRQAIDVGDDGETETMVAPLIGILPAEQVRAIGSDLFGNAELAFIPTGKLEAWLTAYFDEHATPARKAELRRQDPSQRNCSPARWSWTSSSTTPASARAPTA
jgi:hypothetical protein